MAKSTDAKRTKKNNGRKGEVKEKVVHDGPYKAMFKFQPVVMGLLSESLGEDVSAYDAGTLKMESTEFVTEDYRLRQFDSLWSIRRKEDGALMYIHTEFQSTLRRDMPVRKLGYVHELFRQSYDTGGKAAKLPLLHPSVIFSGSAEKLGKPLTGLHDLQEQCTGQLEQYQPRLKYLLIDMNTHEIRDDISENPFSCMMYMVQSTSVEDFIQRSKKVVKAVQNWDESLKMEFGKFVMQTVRIRYHQELTTMYSDQFINEVDEMAHSAFVRVLDEAELKGRQEGMQKGRQEGMQKGRQEGMQKGRQAGRKEGMQEGRQETMLEIAERMIRDDIDDDAVVKYSGLSPQKITKLRKNLNGA